MAEMEHIAVLLALDPNFQHNVGELINQGWQVNPEAPPVAVYHLVRPKHPEGAHAGRGGVALDDSKVHVIKAGANGHDH